MAETLGAAALGLSLLAAVPYCNQAREPAETMAQSPTTTIIGAVSDERITPGSDYYLPRYSFAIDTEGGRKAIQVEYAEGSTHESIEVLLKPGASVEIEVPINQVLQQVITVTAGKIKLK